MFYQVVKTVFNHPGAIIPNGGMLRGTEHRGVVALSVDREKAQEWADKADSGAYTLDHWESQRPTYTVEEITEQEWGKALDRCAEEIIGLDVFDGRGWESIG